MPHSLGGKVEINNIPVGWLLFSDTGFWEVPWTTGLLKRFFLIVGFDKNRAVFFIAPFFAAHATLLA